jgi:hypothetical protein
VSVALPWLVTLAIDLHRVTEMSPVLSGGVSTEALPIGGPSSGVERLLYTSGTTGGFPSPLELSHVSARPSGPGR